MIGGDDSIEGYFRDETRWQEFDSLGRELGRAYYIGPAIGVALLSSRSFQRFTYDLALEFIVAGVATTGIKKLAHRQRPDASDNLSFLSGHASVSFQWATVAQRHYGWKVGAPAYALASYVGASRLKSQKHHLTDVIAGAALGYIVDRTVARNRQDDSNRRFRIGLVVPAGGGDALNLRIRPL